MTARDPGRSIAGGPVRSANELDAWRRLVSEGPARGLVDTVAAGLARDGTPTPAQLDAWRRVAGVEAVRGAVELVRARRASGWKFRDVPGTGACAAAGVVLDVAGGEQASAWAIARHKALRFRERLGAGSRVVDACCGVGADARELVGAGLDVRGIDLDPLRAWMCTVNAGCPAEVADVAEMDPGGAAVHIDPARRTESRSGARTRLRSLDELAPSIGVVAGLVVRSPGAGVKLGPGVDPGDLPALEAPTSVEYISLDGRLSQCVWWTGSLADDRPVRATVITAGGTFSLVGDGARTSARDPCEPRLGAHVFTVDAAIERAGLLSTLAQDVGLAVVHPSLGLLTDEAGVRGGVRGGVDHPAVTPFIVRHVTAWRRERVARWLAENDAGIVEVKTRGKACDPDVEQVALRADGHTPYCVFVLRFGDSVRAIITERPAKP